MARLVAGIVQQFRTLALALLAEALDLCFAVLLLATAAAHLLLGLCELGLGRALCVGLDRVGELCRGADQVERVHPHRVPGRLDRLSTAARSLEHAQLRLELRRMAAERFECLANGPGVEAVAFARNVFEPREGGQRGLLSGFLRRHRERKYAGFIGRPPAPR